MSKVIIDPNLRGKELFAFLRANKEALIAKKKALPQHWDAFSYSTELFMAKDGVATKAQSEDIPADATSIHVKIVGNTSMWCDSHMDVLLRDSALKSMKERKGLIPHLHDHEYNVIDAEVGEPTDIYYEDIPLRQLGLNKPGSAQALIMESDVLKSYNEKAFNKYKAKKIKQHSIGLQYMRLGLAINDDEDTAHYDLWEKHINDVINKEVCEERGYFWVVPEYKLIEISAVLFGSNILTPLLNVEADTEATPPKSTWFPPSYQSEAFNLDEAIKSTKLFN